MTQNNKTAKKVFGVTGITGSGSSTVSSILQKQGGLLISADQVAHDALLKGQPAYQEVVKAFGISVLLYDDEINRKALGAVVFKRPERLKLLEDIIHPFVVSHIEGLLATLNTPQSKHPFAIIDAPLLVESGLNTFCTHICLVTAPTELRVERIQARDGLSPAAIRERIRARKGDEYLQPFAHTVIENATTLADLETSVLGMLA